MKSRLLPEAEADLDRLYDFLVTKNPAAAEKAMLAIDDGVRRLLENPKIGVPMSMTDDRRQLYIPFGRNSYVLRYRIDEETVVVLRIWHSREDRPQ